MEEVSLRERQPIKIADTDEADDVKNTDEKKDAKSEDDEKDPFKAFMSFREMMNEHKEKIASVRTKTTKFIPFIFMHINACITNPKNLGFQAKLPNICIDNEPIEALKVDRNMLSTFTRTCLVYMFIKVTSNFAMIVNVP